VSNWEHDDYIDGPDGAPALEHGEFAREVVRRIVADPGDDSAWLAYSAHLADHGHDAEAIIVRELWPALRDALVTVRSFDAVMADVRRNRTLLYSLAARQATNAVAVPTEPADGPRWAMILLGLAVAVLLAYVALEFVLEVLGRK